MLAVNELGYESGIPDASEVATLPLLQDTAEVNAWGLWDVVYRDVIILDADNHYVATYNLTGNDLGVPENYEALKALILEAEGG